MRLATSLVAALVISTQIAAPVAEACGGYAEQTPAMFLVANHHGRSFVLLGGAVPETAKVVWWHNDRSFDTTQIAKAPALPSAFEVTLTGGTESRTLSTKNQVFIAPAFESKRAMTALEIAPRDLRPRIAVAGKHVTSWVDAEEGADGTTSSIPGTTLTLTTRYEEQGPMTYIGFQGSNPWTSERGTPMGMVTIDGKEFIVLVDDGRLTPVRVWAGGSKG